MYQHWLISYFNKCTTLMQVVSNGETGDRGKSRGFHLPYRNHLLSAQFFCKPKTTLKNKLYLKINKLGKFCSADLYPLLHLPQLMLHALYTQYTEPAMVHQTIMGSFTPLHFVSNCSFCL